MNTRNAKTRQMENQLHLALQELRASREQCELLLKERDDNEKEIISIISKNTQLKSDMVKLHRDYTDILKERDQLQRTFDEFDQCSKEYEESLRLIAALKLQLTEANEQISEFKQNIDNLHALKTQSLFEELVECKFHKTLQPSTTIDLTDDSTTSRTAERITSSRRKLKKYIKINKYIRKVQKLVKTKINIKNYTNVCKEKQELISKIKLYSIEVENMKNCYETEIECLNSEILSLQTSLQIMSNKYQSAGNEIKEHILAMDNLVKSCKYNEERFDSLLKYQTEYQRSLPGSLGTVCVNNTTSSNTSFSLPTLYDSTITKQINLKSNSYNEKNNIIVYSDDIGKNLGISLNNCLKRQQISNYCMPGASFSDIMNKILTSKFNPNSILIIFVGRRGNMNKNQLLKYIEYLNNINVVKVILFTLPYIEGWPQENKLRHNLNLMMHNLTCNNNLNLTFNCKNNNDKFHLIHINNLTKKFLTRDRYYLSKYSLRLVADTLSYYLYFNSANDLATLTPASFEQQNNFTFDLEPVPSNLN
ncbi:unnamed protein product [Parnassius mnemosyne]|uniref:Uncharacterized protein n=1 Tax=Parnassius mnemosyne TaxID=213953 RepID=A0AAV1LYT8_9NEOP